MCQRSDDQTLFAFEDRRLLQAALGDDRRNGRLSRLAYAFALDALNVDVMKSLHGTTSPTMTKEVK